MRRFAAAFAALPGKGEQIGFLSSNDRRPLSEFHHIGGMNAVRDFGFLLEQPEFDREFGPQQVCPARISSGESGSCISSRRVDNLMARHQNAGRSRER